MQIDILNEVAFLLEVTGLTVADINPLGPNEPYHVFQTEQHSHKCTSCFKVWTHLEPDHDMNILECLTGTMDPDYINEEYEKAHSCPNCETVVLDKYYPMLKRIT